MPIVRLRSDVAASIRSTSLICSLAHAVEELVLNALDAGASAISVTFDPANWCASVSDNGTGMTIEDLELVGEWHVSSKASDTAPSMFMFGSRGVALAALACVGTVDIVTRSAPAPRHAACAPDEDILAQPILRKLLLGNGRSLSGSSSPFGPNQTRTPFPSSSPHGTCVSISEFFAALPVRRKAARGTEAAQWQQICRLVHSLCFARPYLRAQLAGPMAASVLVRPLAASAPSCSALDGFAAAFERLFGSAVAAHMLPAAGASAPVSVRGLVSTACFAMRSRDAQLLLVNGRPVSGKSALHRELNELYAALYGGPNGQAVRLTSAMLAGAAPALQHAKTLAHAPAFVLDVCAPAKMYTLTRELARTHVDFTDDGWTHVLRATHAALRQALGPAVERLLVSRPLTGAHKLADILPGFAISPARRRLKRALEHDAHAPDTSEPAPRLARTLSSPPFVMPRTRSIHRSLASVLGGDKRADAAPSADVEAHCAIAEPVIGVPVSVPAHASALVERKLVQTRTSGSVRRRRVPALPASSRAPLERVGAREHATMPPAASGIVSGVDVARLTDAWLAASPSLSRALAIPRAPAGLELSLSKDQIRSGLLAIGQFANKFILARLAGSGLVLIVDQHAAHERCLLEAMQLDTFDGVGVRESVALARPMEFNCTAAEADLLASTEASHRNWGFALKQQPSAGRVRVTSLPRPVLGVAPEKVWISLLEHSHNMRLSKGASSVPPPVLSLAMATAACHAAVRFGDTLDGAQQQAILDDLVQCDLPFQCAHGRPAVIPLGTWGASGERPTARLSAVAGNGFLEVAAAAAAPAAAHWARLPALGT